MPKIRADLLNGNVTALFTLWGDPLDYRWLHLPNRPELLSSAGCTKPKLRLLSEPAVTSDISGSELLLRSGALGRDAVVISNVPDAVRREWENASRASRTSGDIVVNDFRANGLDLTVDVRGGPLWLYYADAWHSDWKATVNGKPQGISRANIGFKALLLPEGRNSVSFFFDRGASYRAALVIVAVGTLVMAALLVLVIRALFFAADTGRNGPALHE
jgi:hypothetical protein